MRILSDETSEKVGKEVELAGWVDARRDHGKLIFIDLRDRAGIVQVVFNAKQGDVYKTAENLRPEWVIKIKGKVGERPAGMINEDLKTGKVEVSADELEILAEADTPPFDVRSDGYEINEELRMKYRYLDLRRKRLKENLKARHRIVSFTRKFFSNKDFIEIETPYISKSTPEGARDYLVPSRQQPGNFYALPQSPQQYKQLLMIAGMERYFQIARCFRDEDTRGDRQAEFVQIDIEVSFTSEEEILDLIEEFLLDLFRELYPNKRLTLNDGKITRMTYEKAMKEYKSDKPDIRKDKKDENELAPVIITDFPMFEKKQDGSWSAVHHPFTMPKVKDVKELKEQFKKDPEKIKAHQYDVALNGWEIFGGSIRNHNPELLSAVFEALGHKKTDIEAKFGHILEAFKYGVPPHGGIASGLDRLVAILQNEPNIREVFAFPKTGDGRDLMMDAPSEVDKDQLDELGISLKKKK
ncbi:MAG: aspartate--tRNA ligase [Candidatus Colwellbacteria bacterium CG10_big_fil_rev_8_21_14_0_10_42_22]|uniref:Aspartate--tRNA(Asp/Asn) ligase n=1 Tax=Candidatus Colwellbacteria bacterium CG10_big_fil_rev_8_21_14_0_10_42_22 TaxID=1974540 RepID=A0A2H0VGB9_9BACT|nr:MAG: aspartate--tRNA ligase [Candidatus Colwellbacteria bacterium CG10_big_fil_rev_8_21_14_0_10_42_22]